MRGGARPRNDSPARSARRRQGLGRGVVVLVAGLLAGPLLAGCADPTGQIDESGHNGYDEMTCEKAKSLALDIQYGTVDPASAKARIDGLSAAAGKAGHPEVRDAATALLAGYRAKDRAKLSAASKALVTACEM